VAGAEHGLSRPGPVKSFAVNGRRYRAPERPTLAICIDGTGVEYLDDAIGRGLMPRLERALADGGRLLAGRAQIPSLTNVNNASIVTGVSAAVHGIAGNHYLAPDGSERQLTEASALRADTILAGAQRAGVRTLAVTAKDKLRDLLGAGGVPSISAERADDLTLEGLGGQTGAEAVGAPAPDIYDPLLSAYAIDLALALADRLGARLVYCSLTDYVQHKAPPGATLADTFCAALDERLGRALDGGWLVGMAADHGMNSKTLADGSPNVRYLSDALAAAGIAGARVVLPITDPYVVHHGALGSLAHVHLDAGDHDRARGALAALPGVEGVLDGAAAALAFELPEDRIGDLVVLADAATVLGSSADHHDLAAVGDTLRSHGGLHEQRVPILVCAPLPDTIAQRRDLRNADLFDLLLNGVPAAEGRTEDGGIAR
jgi:phosphonoacetate hydrolase